AYTVDPMRMMRVRDVMDPDFDTVRGNQTVGEFFQAALRRDSIPVVDDKEKLIGLIHRADLINASRDAKAESLVDRDYKFVYSDEVVHDAVLRFLGGKFSSCAVLERATGTFVGMLTTFDVLKAKHWENLQEVTESGWWNSTMLRF